jgi:hypothetical protein
MFDVIQIQLSYEILGLSVETIADNLGLSTRMIEEMATRGNWVRWFPIADNQVFLDTDTLLSEGDDLTSVQVDRYTESAKRRLQVFSLAKDVLLAEKYLGIELQILNKTKEALMEISPNSTQDLKALSTIYADMHKKIQSATQVTLGKDDTGLPHVIIKDLSGL